MEPFEPPKYIAGLIAAINDGAKSAQLGALAFTVIGLFLLATAFSATDEDLLLNHAISISQLGGAQVPVVFAFGLAPAVFLAAHLYTLIRYDMLAGTLRQFLADLPVMVSSQADRERCRQLLANVEFVNAQVMPARSRSSSWVFRWTVSFVLAVFPVAVLILVQISSLRLQHMVVNWVNHASLFIDLVLLVWFFGRQRGGGDWGFWQATPRRKLALCWLPVMIAVMDLTWLQVPDSQSTTVGDNIVSYSGYGPGPSIGPSTDRPLQVLLALAVQPIDLVVCPYVGWGCRFLSVTHRPIVAKVWDARGFVELRGGAYATPNRLAAFETASLRERSLNFANLTRTELFGTDLSKVKLRHALLLRATLTRATLGEAQLEGAELTEARLEGAAIYRANLQWAVLHNARLEGSNLFGAQLQNADLTGARLQGASLRDAHLENADLRAAQLQGADFSRAQLQGADLRGASMEGADLRGANLWHIKVDAETRMGLSDLRGVVFTRPDATPTKLPRINTVTGPLLTDRADDLSLENLGPEQKTIDAAAHYPMASRLLAEEAAAIPYAADEIAERALEALRVKDDAAFGKDLACRLRANLATGRHTGVGADPGVEHTSTLALLSNIPGLCDNTVP